MLLFSMQLLTVVKRGIELCPLKIDTYMLLCVYNNDIKFTLTFFFYHTGTLIQCISNILAISANHPKESTCICKINNVN